jgi:uncharacterized protein YfdQ (DUF2303 family)
VSDPTTNTFLEAAGGDAQAIIDQAQKAVMPRKVEPGEAYLIVANGRTELVNTFGMAAEPPRKTGSAIFYTDDSFSRYVNDHARPGTALFANIEASRVEGVLNGHEPAELTAGWHDHTATLALRHTPEWDRWTAKDGQLMGQQEFAEHLELGQLEIVEPEAATMVELARTFEANTAVAFKEAIILQSGERKLMYDETTTAKAGQKGDITIPKEFVIGVAPYEGTDRYRVTCQLRYRIREGRLQIGYAMVRPREVLRSAFGDIVAKIEEATEMTAFAGTPQGSVKI